MKIKNHIRTTVLKHRASTNAISFLSNLLGPDPILLYTGTYKIANTLSRPVWAGFKTIGYFSKQTLPFAFKILGLPLNIYTHVLMFVIALYGELMPYTKAIPQ